MSMNITQAEMETRLVRHAQLRGCTTAFIDTRTPGSEQKENFTIIGPGVAESPDQHVHIAIPHGFNIGGARQPPRCVNSQHSHDTAEVFVVHTGQWRFNMGELGEDGSVDLEPGDTISIPTRTFRGFENIGGSSGFLLSVLGGDDPGRVMWAPYVFEAAQRHGLVLLDSGRLIDTNLEAVPLNARPMKPTTVDDVASLSRYSAEDIAKCVVRVADLEPGGGLSGIAGFAECPIIGVVNRAENMAAGKLTWPHGFSVRALRVSPGAVAPLHRRQEEEVIFIHEGTLKVDWSDGSLTLERGDTLTIPTELDRAFSNPGREHTVAYVVRGTDKPAAALWSHKHG